MGTSARWIASISLLALAATGSPRALADGGNTASSVDSVAKQRQDDFEELQKKNTTEAAGRRHEILRGLAFAPCGTARRFLLGLVKKSSAPGDERVLALQSLLHMVDDAALEAVLATLAHDKDPTLWQVFGESVAGARSDVVRAWLKGPALASRDADALGAVLDSYASHADPTATERIEAIYAKHAKPPGSPELAARALRALAGSKGAAVRPVLLEAVRHPEPACGSLQRTSCPTPIRSRRRSRRPCAGCSRTRTRRFDRSPRCGLARRGAPASPRR